jgi:hypothetical protein
VHLSLQHVRSSADFFSFTATPCFVTTCVDAMVTTLRAVACRARLWRAVLWPRHRPNQRNGLRQAHRAAPSRLGRWVTSSPSPSPPHCYRRVRPSFAVLLLFLGLFLPFFYACTTWRVTSAVVFVDRSSVVMRPCGCGRVGGGCRCGCG